MAKKLRKIGHPLRKKNRRKKIKAGAADTPLENTMAPVDEKGGNPPETQAEINSEDAKFYTAKETADMLGVTAKQVTAFLQDNRLPNAEKVSGRWRIPETDIQALKKDI